VSLLARLPGGGGHNSRSVGIGPTAGCMSVWGYKAIAAINISMPATHSTSDARIYVLRENGVGVDFHQRGKTAMRDYRKIDSDPIFQWEVFAAGLRNPIGFAGSHRPA